MGGGGEVLAPLLALLQRQTRLKVLAMALNEGFSSEQEEQVRAAVPNQECRLIFDKYEFQAYREEQNGVKPASEVSKECCCTIF